MVGESRLVGPSLLVIICLQGHLKAEKAIANCLRGNPA
jgi:hypothetical protein